MSNVKKPKRSTVLGFKQFKAWVLSRAGEVHTTSSKMIVGDFISYLIINDKPKQHTESFSNSHLLLVEDLWNTPISKMTRFQLRNSSDKVLTKFTVRRQNSIRNDFFRAFIMPAASYNLLHKDFNKLGMASKYIGINSESIKTSERTVQWYVAEAITRNPHISIPKCDRVCERFLHLKPKDLNRTHVLQTIKEFTNSGSIYLKDVLDIMIEDNLLDKGFYHNDKVKIYTFDNDIWEIIDGKKESTLDFQILDRVHNLKVSVKHWIQWRINQGYKSIGPSIRRIIIGFMPFLEKKEITLKDFSRSYKKDYLTWLRNEEESGNCTESVAIVWQGAAKSLLTYLQENHPEKVNTKIKWTIGESAFKKDNKKTNAYAPFEIDELRRALDRDKDRFIVLLIKLLLFTGKRLDEIKSLKRDCLIEIAGIKYLKYTNSKIKKEARLPLSSNPNKSLFEKDVSSIVKDCVNELLDITDKIVSLCNKKDSVYLFLIKTKLRSSKRKNAEILTDYMMYERIKDFRTRNRIKFQISPKRTRNTIATEIIRSGRSAETASRILGNNAKTVHLYYHSDIKRNQTVHIANKAVVYPTKDAKELNALNQIPKAVATEQARQMGTASVPGGECKKGIDGAKQCSYYNRMFGSGGCLGCSELVVTIENKPWYDHMDKSCLNEIEQLRETPFIASARNKHRLVAGALNEIISLEGIND